MSDTTNEPRPPWDDGPRTTQTQPFWVTCPRCTGTGKSAGMDCPDCGEPDLDGLPLGRILVRRV